MRNIWLLIKIYLSLSPYKRITLSKDIKFDLYKNGVNKRVRDDR